MSLESTDAQVNEILAGTANLANLMSQGLTRDEALMELVRIKRGASGQAKVESMGARSLSRDSEVMRTGEEDELLRQAGVDPNKYKTGARFDNQNRTAGDNTTLAFIQDNDQSELQNWGGVDKQGRTKDAGKAIEEQSRARKRQNIELGLQAPSARPSVDEYLDDLVRKGLIDNETANRRAYAMKKSGVTDPVGDQMKTRDFGVSYTPDRVEGMFPGSYQVRNDRGYKGQFIWQPTGDLEIERGPKEINMSGTYVLDENTGVMERELMGQYAGTGNIDADGNAQYTPNIGGTGVGLNLDNPGLGSRYIIEGGVGKFIDAPKGMQGVTRIRYRDVGDQTSGTFSDGRNAMNDAAARIRQALADGSIPVEKQAEAQRLLNRLELSASPEKQVAAEKALTRSMIAADNEEGKINEQIKAENLNRAVANAEIGLSAPSITEELPNGLMPVMHESEDRFQMEPVISGKQAMENDPARFAGAIFDGTTYRDEFNQPISDESPSINNLYRTMLGLSEGQTESDLVPRSQRWMESAIIDQRDYDVAGTVDENLPRMDIGEALNEINSQFAKKKIKTNIRSLGDLEQATNIYLAKKKGKINVRDQATGKSVRVTNPGIGDILTDMKFTSPQQKRLARALFTLESSYSDGGPNVSRNREFGNTGQSVFRSEAPIFPEDIVEFGTVGSEKVDGKNIAAEFRKLNPEARVRGEIESELANAADVMERKLTPQEVDEITGEILERNRFLDPDGRDMLDDTLADMRMPTSGVKKGQKSGRQNLSAQVFQGMSNNQIRAWYEKAGKSTSDADKAVANASALRAREKSRKEDQAAKEFASRTVNLSPDPNERNYVNETGRRVGFGEADVRGRDNTAEEPRRQIPRNRIDMTPPGSPDPMPKFEDKSGMMGADFQGTYRWTTRPQPITEARVAPSMSPDPWAETGPAPAPVADAGGAGMGQGPKPPAALPYGMDSDGPEQGPVYNYRSPNMKSATPTEETQDSIMAESARRTRKKPSSTVIGKARQAGVGVGDFMTRDKYRRNRRIGAAALGAGGTAVLAGMLGIGNNEEEEQMYR